MVPVDGLEPSHPQRRGILNPLCLPIPPHWHKMFDSNRLVVAYAVNWSGQLYTKQNRLQWQILTLRDLANIESESL